MNIHALSIYGKQKNQSRKDLLTVAKSMNIKKAKEIMKEIYLTIQRWGSYADKVAVPQSKRDAIAKTLITF